MSRPLNPTYADTIDALMERVGRSGTVIMPAFVLSELRRAFEMGFMIYLPFVVIDLVVSAILVSMGMLMLPPVIVSLPFKVLVFVLVDGWGLVVEQLMVSTMVTAAG